MAQIFDVNQYEKVQELNNDSFYQLCEPIEDQMRKLNELYNLQADRSYDYSLDILKYFEKDYQLENGQHQLKSNGYDKSIKIDQTNSDSSKSGDKIHNQPQKHQSLLIPLNTYSKLEDDGPTRVNSLGKDSYRSERKVNSAKDHHLDQNILIFKKGQGTDQNKNSLIDQNKFLKYFHHSTNQLVQHQELHQEAQIYKPNEEDLQNQYLEQAYSLIFSQNNENMDNLIFKNRISTQFIENTQMCDYFISQCYFQTVKQEMKQQFVFIFSQFWNFNHSSQKFQFKSQFLIDILEGVDEQYLLTNKILSVNEHQFFLVKDQIKKGFQMINIKCEMPSNYEFFQQNNSKQLNKITKNKLQNFEICLPDDWPYKLEELDYSFIQNSTFQMSPKNFNPNAYLKQQYVLIKSIQKQDKLNNKPSAFLIYQLDNPFIPIIRFQNNEFEGFHQSFFTVKDKNQIVFTLKSNYSVYEIIYDCRKDPIKAESANGKYEIENDHRIKSMPLKIMENQQQEDDDDETQLFTFNQVIPQNLKVILEDDYSEENFVQYYYLDNDGEVNLIYPLHLDDEVSIHDNVNQEQLNKKQGKVISYIKQKIGFIEETNLGISVHFKNNTVMMYQITKEMVSYLEMEGKPKEDDIQIIYCTKDVLLCICQNQNDPDVKSVHLFSIKNSVFHGDFNQQCLNIFKMNAFTNNRDYQTDIMIQSYRNSEDQSEKPILKRKNNLLQKILNQFDWIQQYNQISQANIFNQKIGKDQLESFYLNKRKKGIFQTHNKFMIEDKQFIIDSKYVLLDLYQNDKHEKDPIKLLKLCDDEISDLHLIKYHVSNNSVIFFFHLTASKILNGKDQVQDVGQDNKVGIEFFVMKSFQQIKIMILKNEPLIQKNSTIYIPVTLKKILIEKYSEQMKFKKLLQMQQKMEIQSHKLAFETVVDLSDPTSQWLPFIYHSKVDSTKYDHFFCFLDLEQLSEKIINQDQDQQGDEINFSQFIQAFKIDYYQNDNESYKFKKVKETDDSYRNHNHSAKAGGISMFSRCSNWQKNIFEDQNDDYNLFFDNELEQYSARFQIGVNLIFDDLQMVEVQEYLVTIDCKQKMFYNKDQAQFQDLQYKNMQKSNVQILPIQQRFLIKSQQYKTYQQQYKNLDFFEKERIIPNINDDGQIDGSLILLNQSQTRILFFQLTDNIQNLQKHTNQEQLKNLQDRLGQYIYVISKGKSSFSGYFSDGFLIKSIKFQVTKDYETQIYLNSSNGELQVKEDQILLEFQNIKNKINWYNLIQLADQYNDDDFLQPIFGPLTRQSIKRLSFNNQLSNQIFLCSTTFNKETIISRHFDKDESIYWLYFFSKFLLCMSLPNFEELLNGQVRERIEKYFQPRYVLLGKSFAHLDLQYNVKSIQNLQLGMIFKQQDPQLQHSFLENSSIYRCLVNGNTRELNSIVKCLGLGKYYGLQYNYLSNESIIQRSLDNNRMKPVSFIVEYILNRASDKELCTVITQDLPQLIESSKINVNKYLDISYQEENTFEQIINNFNLNLEKLTNRNLFFNFEQVLLNDNLPAFGSEEASVKFIDFQHPFFSFSHLSDIIINENKKNNNSEIKKDDDLLEEDELDTDGLVQIQYSYIDFTPIIRKIKFDKILGREPNELEGTQYLELIQDDLKDINYVDDLLISSIIDKGSEMNPTVIEQSTVKRIVELQYKRVRPIIKKQLFFYLLFFCAPFVYNTVFIGLTHDSEQSSLNQMIIKFNYVIGLLAQCVLMLLEFADIKFNGFANYFSDGWNIFDSSQFFTYLIHIFIRFQYQTIQNYGNLKILDDILQIVICIQGTVKILQFLRYHDEFSFLVSMITHVFLDLIPFFTVFFMYVFLFALISIIMEADFDDNDYQEVPIIVRIFLQTFRNAIGDLTVQRYGAWAKESPDKSISFARSVAITVIWIFWFFNVLGMVIILINLLISQVGSTYSTVLEQGTQFLYLQKAELNQHVFKIEKLFGIKNKFKAIIFQQPKQDADKNEQDNQFDCLRDLLKKNESSLGVMKKDLQQLTNIVNSDSEKHENMMTEKIQNISEKIDFVISNSIQQSKIQQEDKQKFQDQINGLQNLIENYFLKNKVNNQIEKTLSPKQNQNFVNRSQEFDFEQINNDQINENLIIQKDQTNSQNNQGKQIKLSNNLKVYAQKNFEITNTYYIDKTKNQSRELKQQIERNNEAYNESIGNKKAKQSSKLNGIQYKQQDVSKSAMKMIKEGKIGEREEMCANISQNLGSVFDPSHKYFQNNDNQSLCDIIIPTINTDRTSTQIKDIEESELSYHKPENHESQIHKANESLSQIHASIIYKNIYSPSKVDKQEINNEFQEISENIQTNN